MKVLFELRYVSVESAPKIGLVPPATPDCGMGMPPIGTPVTIKVQVVGVPGEKNLTNNKATYTAIFQR